MEADKVTDLATAVRPYLDLLLPLVDGTLSPDQFETAFFDRYQADQRLLSTDVFDVFDGFFSDVDEYVDDPALRDTDNGELGPDELKASAEALLRRAGLLP